MKYSEIIGVQKHFQSVFDIIADNGDRWKTFISNERFESNLSKIIQSFTSPVLNKRKSIWIQGTYGTGKSHSLAVIKHLLCDDYENIEDYLPRISRSQVRNSIIGFRREKKVFPVVLKGMNGITDIEDLTYVIQNKVAETLGDIEIATKTDFQTVLQILKNPAMNSFFEKLLEENIELHSYAENKEQLIKRLENHETRIIRIIADELKKAGLGGFRTHDIVQWLVEVKNELQERGIADYLMIMWDEFTSLLEIQESRSILNVMQDIAELSYAEVNNGTDTQGVYVLLITHKKLEVTESYKQLKEDERNMARARFTELSYGMQPTTTFHILSGALDRKQPEILNNLIQENISGAPSVRALVDKVVDNETVNAGEIKEKIISLYPFHPYTSYLATFVSRVIGEAERSIFGFLNDEEYGFKRFIENDIEDKKFLTADYVWDFFFSTFEEKSAGNFDVITNKFKLAGETVEEKGEYYSAVFKTILLLNILYRVTTTEADISESNMVRPSTENIVGAFTGVLDQSEVLRILTYIDENEILHCNPDGVFEVASSALPQKRILEEKKKLYPNREDVSKIVEEYSIRCKGALKNTISRGVLRELDLQVFWGGEKEYLLRGKIHGKFSKTYTVNVALMLYRGETKELNDILDRSEMDQTASMDMILRLSKEEEFKDIVFILANTELGNRRYEAYLESLAQEAVARSLQMDEERIEGEKNAEKWILQWVNEIIGSGMAEIVFRGDTVHAPFNRCNHYLRENYIPTIFKYGLDTLPVANTAWALQSSKKVVEIVLYSHNKEEVEKGKGVDGAVVKALLVSGNTLLFDDDLNLVSDDESIPVVKVCKEIQRLLEKKKNETSIHLEEEFRYLTAPEYGYYSNRLFMGAFALALRPYIDKLYISGNGQRVDQTVLKDIVVGIFNYWERDKFNDKLHVRMSTEEERALTERLNMIFGIADKEGLLGTKWAIRDRFKKQSKAPLWALKYVGEHSKEYKSFIDKMFRFSKSTDENIQQSFIVELLEDVKAYDIELSAAVASVQDSQCLDTYLLKELKDINEDSDSLESAKTYLEGQMSGDLAFWEEDEVHEKILRWKIERDRQAETLKKRSSDNHEHSPMPAVRQEEERSGSISDSHVNELRARVKNKLEENQSESEKLYNLLVVLADKYADILQDIDELL